MKRHHPFHFFLIFLLVNCARGKLTNDDSVASSQSRDFGKDMDELDLSGLENDIENIEEIAYSDRNYQFVTQMYVYVRVDTKYKKYLNHLQLISLGEKYMTLLQNAMMHVQIKKTGVGVFTCFYQDKAIKENLVTYFLLQKEVDFVEVGFDTKFPEGRDSPITDADRRMALQGQTNDEL
ncbi:hypothetical protein, conserved [Plasmodium gonderi]|uniref:Uncharacterized protein n=1 Tax=Plasmodium gonderi TaxID=77519 RepID=A0A1Y1JDW9_PLAGO|nr:hypothetical protein, conserved [Plasmodium gonderi]GAW80729.1 hypothetical protein, conserved [Plasmodium gonderi]